MSQCWMSWPEWPKRVAPETIDRRDAQPPLASIKAPFLMGSGPFSELPPDTIRCHSVRVLQAALSLREICASICLKRLLLQAFGDALGKIIGGAQVLAEKTNFSLDAVSQDHAPIAVGHPSVDTHVG
jgi:hypothetical protein